MPPNDKNGTVALKAKVLTFKKNQDFTAFCFDF
jgi:hypothetical protein